MHFPKRACSLLIQCYTYSIVHFPKRACSLLLQHYTYCVMYFTKRARSRSAVAVCCGSWPGPTAPLSHYSIHYIILYNIYIIIYNIRRVQPGPTACVGERGRPPLALRRLCERERAPLSRSVSAVWAREGAPPSLTHTSPAPYYIIYKHISHYIPCTLHYIALYVIYIYDIV